MPNKLEEKDWELLLRRIKDGKCTPFLGAGACSQKIPVGSQIANEWAKRYDYPMEDSYNLTKVAQYVAVIRDAMTPKEEMCIEIKEKLKEIAPIYFENPDEPHGVLADLPLPVYITTNYDDFMVRALESHGKTPNQEICRWNKSLKKPKRKSSDFNPTPEKPLVFHLHGSYKIPQSLVLTEDDYLDFSAASRDQNLIPPRIQEAFTDTTFLFLGYSITDWDFRVLFRILAEYLEKSISRTHLSVQLVPGNVSGAQKEKVENYLDRYFANLNIHVYWQDCREFAKELRTRWEARNLKLVEPIPSPANTDQIKKDFKYDIAISYASENRKIVEEIAEKLKAKNIRVFYDIFEKSDLWGKRLSTNFQQIYGEKACFVLVFVSEEYSVKDWTSFEFTIARDAAKARKTEFILPVRLDNTPLVGLPDDIAYLDFKKEGIEGIVHAVIDKVNYLRHRLTNKD